MAKLPAATERGLATADVPNASRTTNHLAPLALVVQGRRTGHPGPQWVFTGLFVGAMMPYALAAWTMKSVGKAANDTVKECLVRSPKIMNESMMPDYGVLSDLDGGLPERVIVSRGCFFDLERDIVSRGCVFTDRVKEERDVDNKWKGILVIGTIPLTPVMVCMSKASLPHTFSTGYGCEDV